MTAPQKDPVVIENARAALLELKDSCSSLVYAALVTDDGFEIASQPSAGHHDDRLASMSSSVQALADAVSRELTMGDSEFVILAAESGHIIQRRVPEHPMVLAAVFDHHETLGKALSISRLTTERLRALPHEAGTRPAA